MAPEYAMHGYLTDKADIYSFGIVALEVVSGRSNSSSQKNEECFYLLDWVINSIISIMIVSTFENLLVPVENGLRKREHSM